jgi:hypothetical protein
MSICIGEYLLARLSETPAKRPWALKPRRVNFKPVLLDRLSSPGMLVNSTNALPYFDFFGCDCGHLGRSADLVASLLVNLEFCRIRFWYLVVPGSGISRTALP